MISYIIPTRNRHEALHQTIETLHTLHAAQRIDAEAIIIDNKSDAPLRIPQALNDRLHLRVERLDQNIGAAARNVGAELAQSDWLIMLDDDSYPLDLAFIDVLLDVPADIAAIGAEIFLPDGSRERGGLPEVVIGCGAAIRRDAFLQVGGYDPGFDYYAEEYDLCAKFIMRGRRIGFDRQFRVLHKKINSGRNFNRIIQRLVRNNGWVAQRFAPDDELHSALGEVVSRYGSIAVKEHAADGFAHGMEELLTTLNHQPRTPMSQEMWDRFTGLAHARQSLRQRCKTSPSVRRVAIIDEGKHASLVHQAVAECRLELVKAIHDAQAVIVGTLSPGPMLDSLERWSNRHKCVWAPWSVRESDQEVPQLQNRDAVGAIAA